MRNGSGSPARWVSLPKAWLAGGIAVVAATAGLVVVTASPANADPATTYVAVGSDTTQDVMNGMAAIIGGGTLGSWDAVNPGNPTVTHDIINPKAGCSMARPNGSGEGALALRKSINPASGAVPPAPPPSAGCVDIGRASSTTNIDQNGLLVYIPFGLDVVAPATGPVSNVANLDQFTLTQMQNLYKCTPQLVGGVTYDPNTTPAPGNQAVHLYIPQSGSGTRNFWADTMGIPRAGNACTHDTQVNGGANPPAVQEHDGTVLAADPDGIGPFSAAQWVAQSRGHNDRRHGAILHNLNGVTPLVSGAINVNFPVRREVYNLVQLSRVTPTDPAFDPALSAMFVGGSSKVCSNPLTIRDFGFALLSGSPLGHACGAVATDLRAQVAPI